MDAIFAQVAENEITACGLVEPLRELDGPFMNCTITACGFYIYTYTTHIMRNKEEE